MVGKGVEGGLGRRWLQAGRPVRRLLLFSRGEAVGMEESRHQKYPGSKLTHFE